MLQGGIKQILGKGKTNVTQTELSPMFGCDKLLEICRVNT